TYTGPGRFRLSVEDPNRNNNILNLKPPNGQSDQVVFYIESILIINPFSPSPPGPVNNSAILLNPPIDQACLGQPYRHNPGAFDPDGDSLVYSLVPNRADGGQVPNYYVFPDQIAPGGNNNISIDSRTGDVLWDAPQQAGQYNIAILIQEFRQGVLVGSVLRDMQITVQTCDNIAPEISLITQDTCVIAGSFIQLPVSANDPNNDALILSASGLPFEVSSGRAQFTQQPNSSNATFNWSTNCSHVRKTPYQVVVKAEDQNPDVQLVDFKTFQISVLGPPVRNVQVGLQNGAARLVWSNYESICSNATAIKIYRRKGNTNYQVPLCTTGMPEELDYTLLTTVNEDVVEFLDPDIENNSEYCYRLVACFADGSESVVSEEACTSINTQNPALTHVSIGQTDQITGIDTIRWGLPRGIDTINAFPPPYQFVIYEGIGVGNANTRIGNTPPSNQFYQSDSSFIRRSINTQDTILSYRVEFLSNGNTISSSGISSSLFLDASAGDRVVVLTWLEDVNWGNFQYQVERFNENTSNWDSIGMASNPYFEDRNVINELSYCYRILAFGKYNSGNYPAPFLNYSQETCATPFDNVPPCPPVLSIVANCESEEVNITWQDTNFVCSEDVNSYELYYKATLSGDFQLVERLAPSQMQFIFAEQNTVAGCFYVTATDENGNQSEPSNVLCSDNCPAYQLPDVITPNGDGSNDFFRPFSSKFVKEVDFKIFNRWGKLVFETSDPQINWNGNYRETNQPVADGTYFYVADLSVITLEGLEKQQISGYITLLR
ncbi:MAG: gliding motility-associated C-terminal domain-containing protein, partial [Luteibaculum sp.]